MGHFFTISCAILLLSSLTIAFPFGGNLEYEYATVLSYFILIVVPFIAIFVPKQQVAHHFRTVSDPLALRWWQQWRINDRAWILIVAPLFVLAPGLTQFARNACQCSQSGFLFWISVQTIPALWLAFGMHWVILRIRYEGVQVHRRISIVYLAFFIWLFLAAAELWFFPQKRLIHGLLGFIHGPIYDAWIPVDNGVILARTAHAVLGLALVQCAWWPTNITIHHGHNDGARGARRLAIACVLVSLGLWLGSRTFPSTGFGKDALISILSTDVSEGPVTLHFKDHRKNAISGHIALKDAPTEIRILARDAAFHAMELTKTLNTSIERPIDIYVYPSDESKKIWFGGGATDVTDVWSPSIHITLEPSPHPSLRHELVHAISSRFGFWGIGFHPNMAITEGLAMALAPSDRRLDLDQASAAILHDGRVHRVEDLFSLSGFWSESGPRAYTLAGSFLNFMLKEAGPDAVRTIYRGASFDSATGKNLSFWTGRWREFVQTRYVEQSKLETEALFRAPGVLHDLCPHTRADYMRTRQGSIWTRLRQPLGWDPSQWYMWRIKLSPDNLDARLDVWRRQINEFAQKKTVSPMGITTWVETLDRAKAWPPKTIEDVEIALLQSDLLRIGRDRDASLTLLQEIYSRSLDRPPGDALERQVIARLKIEENFSSDMTAKQWRQYLAGWRGLPDKQEDEPWIANYLRFRRDSSQSHEALVTMLADPFSAAPQSFRSEWLRLLAVRFVEQEDYKNANEAYSRLLIGQSGDSRKLYEEHVRRTQTLMSPNAQK